MNTAIRAIVLRHSGVCESVQCLFRVLRGFWCLGFKRKSTIMAKISLAGAVSDWCSVRVCLVLDATTAAVLRRWSLAKPVVSPRSSLHEGPVIGRWMAWQIRAPFLCLASTVSLLKRTFSVPPCPGPLPRPRPVEGERAAALLASLDADLTAGKKLGPFAPFSFVPTGFTSVFNVPKPGERSKTGLQKFRTIINCSAEPLLSDQQAALVHSWLDRKLASGRDLVVRLCGQRGGLRALASEAKTNLNLRTTSNDFQKSLPMPVDLVKDFVVKAGDSKFAWKADMRAGFQQLLTAPTSAGNLTFEVACKHPVTGAVHRFWLQEPTAPQGASESPPRFNRLVRSFLKILVCALPPVFSKRGRAKLVRFLVESCGVGWDPNSEQVWQAVLSYRNRFQVSEAAFNSAWAERTIFSFLDDIFGASGCKKSADLMLACLKRYAVLLGIDLNPKKVFPAAEVQLVLGFNLDFESKIAWLKEGYPKRIRSSINKIRRSWGATTFVESVEACLGELTWAVSLVPKAFSFLGLLTEAKLSFVEAGAVEPGLKLLLERDLRTLERFFAGAGPRVPFRRLAGAFRPIQAEGFCDASGAEINKRNPRPETLGGFFAFRFEPRSAAVCWSISWARFRRLFQEELARVSGRRDFIPLQLHPSICRLEAWGVIALLESVRVKLGSKLRGRLLVIHCDNTVVVSWGRKGSCKFGVYRLLLRWIFLLEADLECRIVIKWISSGANCTADKLTRLPLGQRSLGVKGFRGRFPISGLGRGLVRGLAVRLLEVATGSFALPYVRFVLFFFSRVGAYSGFRRHCLPNTHGATCTSGRGLGLLGRPHSE